MLYIILALFLASLFGIGFMIGRKWILIQNGYVFEKEPVIPNVEYAEELKRWAKGGLRRLSFILLVIVIRIYVKISSYIVRIYQRLEEKRKEAYREKFPEGQIKIKTPNKFLQKMGDYKKKVKRIKEKVKREERMK